MEELHHEPTGAGRASGKLLLPSVPLQLQGLESGYINAAYRAVSVVGRNLLEVTAEHMLQIVHDSRVTHETANTVMMVWEHEGRGVIEAASEHLRQEVSEPRSQVTTG